MKLRQLFAAAALGLTLAFGLISLAVADEADIETELGVEYTNPQDTHLKLDLARPKNSEGLAPGVVCIHGGGWAAGDRAHWRGICGHLARRGYVAVTISYRFAPTYPFPAAVNDAKAAVRWLRANAERLKLNPDRIGALGDSAGGHLSQFLGVTGDVPEFDRDGENLDRPSRIQCVVNFYGPNDMTKMEGVLPDVDKLVSQFLGGDLEHARRAHVISSPLYWVTPNAAPTLIIHGTKDDVVPLQQAELMRDRLQAVDVPVELMTVEGAGHGFSGDDTQRTYDAMFAFLDKHLKTPE